MAAKQTRNSQPAQESKFIARNGKQIQRAINQDENTSLTQSVPADHTKTAGSAEIVRRKAKSVRDKSTNLGRGIPAQPTIE